MDREQINIIVRDVLQQKGLLDRSTVKSAAKRIKRPCPTPAVLNVFHPGVRYLESALEQVRLIEKMAGKSSVFTVHSARDWVCGQDRAVVAAQLCDLCFQLVQFCPVGTGVAAS